MTRQRFALSASSDAAVSSDRSEFPRETPAMATLTLSVPGELAEQLQAQADREGRPVEEVAAERLASAPLELEGSDESPAEDELPDIDPMSWTDPMKPSPVLSAEAAEDLWRRTQEWTPPPVLLRLLKESRERFGREEPDDG